MSKVACDDGTGILTVHDATETCDICKPGYVVSRPGCTGDDACRCAYHMIRLADRLGRQRENKA